MTEIDPAIVEVAARARDKALESGFTPRQVLYAILQAVAPLLVKGERARGDRLLALLIDARANLSAKVLNDIHDRLPGAIDAAIRERGKAS